MDLSRVPSSTRTDFSIDRLLREEQPRSCASFGVNQSLPATPSWVNCTRYQPPKVQRSIGAGAGGGGRSRRAGRHARVPFTGPQAAALEAAFHRAHYLAPPALRALAAALSLREDRIKIWFQNRRARERREKTTAVVPPHAINIPATLNFTSSTSQPRLTVTDRTKQNILETSAAEDSDDLPVDVVSLETDDEFCTEGD